MRAASPTLARWGRWAFRHRRALIVAWLLLLLACLPLAATLPEALARKPSSVEPYEAARVQALLDAEFQAPFAEPLLVVWHAARPLDAPRDRQAMRRLGESLRGLPGVARVLSPGDDPPDARLRSPDERTAVLLVGLRKGMPPGYAEQIRETLRRGPEMPGVETHVTGALALAADISRATAQDSHHAEVLMFAPALVALLLLFGSPLAALLPIMLGFVASGIASGLAALVALLWPINAFAQTTLTMLGLALGIDYALLVVARFRQSRCDGLPIGEAIATTTATAGWTVLCSGAVVGVALAALVPSGLADTWSVGIGGALVTAVAVLLALSLLPAALALLAPWLEWPARSSRRPWGLWQRWAEALTRQRGLAAAGALAILVVMAWPLKDLRAGMPELAHLPADLEAVRGLKLLAGAERGQLGHPILVHLQTTDGSPILSARALEAMGRLSRDLHRDARVADVLGPVDLQQRLTMLQLHLLYADPEAALKRFPAIAENFLSHDRRSALMTVVPTSDLSLAQAQQLVRDLRARPHPGLRLAVGGSAARNLDYQEHLLSSLRPIIGGMVLATALLLGWAFRSVAIPLKAIALNLLSVGAALGTMVRVFQWGQGAGWIGLESPLSAIPSVMLVLVFCLTFGLSMDYELFMVSRVREAVLNGSDTSRAIHEGLGATGGVIAGAALMMIIVFSAFVAARSIFVKLLGFGLATAILVDATVIRLLLAPALLGLAGRWNWWPGARPRA